jgi:hypothetical protein
VPAGGDPAGGGGVAADGAGASAGGSAESSNVISEQERKRLEHSKRCELVLEEVNEDGSAAFAMVIRAYIESHALLGSQRKPTPHRRGETRI